MADFVMPTLGADMDYGTVLAWRKKPGDRVKRGEIIAEVDTDKAAIEIEVFTDGVLEKILVQPGQKVPVGTLLATIKEEGAPTGMAARAPTATPPRPVAPPTEPPAPRPAVPPALTRPAHRLRISPAARKLAHERGIDLSTLAGTGPEGAISLDDVERAAMPRGPKREARPEELHPPLAPGPLPLARGAEGAAGTDDRQARMRQVIAAAMARSKREIPHYYLGTTIDLNRAMTWLAEENLRRPVPERLLYGVLLLKAVALALREVPELNATWQEGRVVQSPAIHVGVAISLRGGGLVAPAIHDTDQKSLADLMRDFRDLVKRARAGTLRASELSDPTITVTSLGEQGVETVFGVIYPPQVALVGFGKVVERPWVSDGKVAARHTLTATLSGDHRVTDGHRGGLLLAAVDRLLQEPGRL